MRAVRWTCGVKPYAHNSMHIPTLILSVQHQKVTMAVLEVPVGHLEYESARKS